MSLSLLATACFTIPCQPTDTLFVIKLPAPFDDASVGGGTPEPLRPRQYQPSIRSDSPPVEEAAQKSPTHCVGLFLTGATVTCRQRGS